MAYLHLLADADHMARLVPAPAMAAGRATADAFSQREWTIIRLAREDRVSSLREETAFKRFLRLIFGLERKTPFSDPALEGLRRIAVLSWHHGYNVDGAEVAAFLDAGYSTDQYELLLAHIGRERAVPVRRAR
ncbi:MAG TPA: hypothetical protein VNS79_01345 [Sphingobium sp.]|nr:hypothetical protein [Sphingobium sp.]